MPLRDKIAYVLSNTKNTQNNHYGIYPVVIVYITSVSLPKLAYNSLHIDQATLAFFHVNKPSYTSHLICVL